MAMVGRLRRAAPAGASISIAIAIPWRGISMSRILDASGTKKGKIVEAAKKSGYKKGGGGKKPDKKAESKNVKDAGLGSSVRIQVQNKRKTIEPTIKISDAERETMLADLSRLAKETSRILMLEHRAKQRSENEMLKAKLAAIAALPEHLRAQIRPPIVRKRQVPHTLIPPVGGYAVEAAAAHKAAVFKKRR